MTSDPTQRRSQNLATLRGAGATAIFLGAIFGASAGLACCPNVTGNPHDPNSYASPPAARPPDGAAESKTCDKGLVWSAKKKKCVIKRGDVEPDLTICFPGQVRDKEHQKCLERRAGVLPDPDLTEYAVALAGAGRYEEAIDVLDLLENPNTPVALNYRGYATRKLGRTDEGIGYYLKSVALDPAYPQVREYLGEAYVIEGKYDLAKEQLTTIAKLCGSRDCQYYRDLAEALEQAHAL